MKPHADYEIKIIDPEDGDAIHGVYRYIRGKRKKLAGLNKFEYDATRFIKRTNNGKRYDDLDFFISKKKSTVLKFEIAAAGWTFKSGTDAITFTDEPPEKYTVTRPVDEEDNEIKTQVHLEVPGASSIKEGEFKYSLHFIEPTGSPLEFDPIINNGSLPPSIRSLLIKMTFYSALFSTATAVATAAILVKLGII